MARTKASVGAKISSGKSSKARCSVAPSIPSTSSGVTSGGSRGSGGGNPVCPRETPKWQKPITRFFINTHDDSRDSDDGETAGSSKTKSKHNIIQSSDEDTTPEKPKYNKQQNDKQQNNEEQNKEKPKNSELDESIELESLSGESSHKIQEYYPKNTKGKGKGKKTKETKNANSIGMSEKENSLDGEEKTQDSNENLNDSNSDTTRKGKGIGKKTKETKHVNSNGVSEKEDVPEKDGKSDLNGNKSDGERDKENVDSNIDKDRDIASDKDASIGRKKREREDPIEENNISKKVKVN